MLTTKRLYGKESGYTDPLSVIPGDEASEANGSKPYNEALIVPRIGQIMPDWLDATGTPYVDPYALGKADPDLTGSDGIHGYGAAIARYILARVAERALGLAEGGSRAGRSILYNIAGGEPNDMTWGGINTVLSYPAEGLNHPTLYGAGNVDGGFDPFAVLRAGGTYQGASGGAGTGTYARIADTRFHHPEIVNQGIYVQGAQVYRLDLAGLTPGDRMIVTAIGVRDAGGTQRRGALTLEVGGVAQTRELDASSESGANQVVFAPETIPATGAARLSLAVAEGASYGYLHGLVLDFV